MIGRVLALSLAVMKTTDLTREVLERVTGLTPQPYLKSAFATALSAGLAAAYADSWRDRLELAGAIAGTSAMLHEAQGRLSGDGQTVVLPRRRGGGIPPL